MPGSLQDELNFGGSLFDEVMAALNVALSNRGVPTEGSSTSAKDEAAVPRNNITTASSSNSTIVAESHSEQPSDSEDDYHHKLSSSPGAEVSEGREHLARGQTKFTSSAYASSRIPISYC